MQQKMEGLWAGWVGRQSGESRCPSSKASRVHSPRPSHSTDSTVSGRPDVPLSRGLQEPRRAPSVLLIAALPRHPHPSYATSAPPSSPSYNPAMPSFDLVVTLAYHPQTTPYRDQAYEQDNPWTCKRLHIALATLQFLDLIDYDVCILSKTIPWQVYLFADTLRASIQNFATLRNLRLPIPRAEWQTFPLVKSLVSWSHSHATPAAERRAIAQRPCPANLQEFYQGTRHIRPPPQGPQLDPSLKWLQLHASTPRFHQCRPPWLPEEDTYPIPCHPSLCRPPWPPEEDTYPRPRHQSGASTTHTQHVPHTQPPTLSLSHPVIPQTTIRASDGKPGGEEGKEVCFPIIGL